MRPQDRPDGGGIQVPAGGGELAGDQARLGLALGRVEVLVAAPEIGHEERDDRTTGDEPDDQEPPDVLGHLSGQSTAPRYTRPS